MADEASTRVRSMVEKLLEADMTDQIAQRSREIAERMELLARIVTGFSTRAGGGAAP